MPFVCKCFYTVCSLLCKLSYCVYEMHWITKACLALYFTCKCVPLLLSGVGLDGKTSLPNLPFCHPIFTSFISCCLFDIVSYPARLGSCHGSLGAGTLPQLYDRLNHRSLDVAAGKNISGLTMWSISIPPIPCRRRWETFDGICMVSAVLLF